MWNVFRQEIIPEACKSSVPSHGEQNQLYETETAARDICVEHKQMGFIVA
jgi:hypothetical protein